MQGRGLIATFCYASRGECAIGQALSDLLAAPPIPCLPSVCLHRGEDHSYNRPYGQNTRTHVPARGYTLNLAFHFGLFSASHSWILTGNRDRKGSGGEQLS